MYDTSQISALARRFVAPAIVVATGLVLAGCEEEPPPPAQGVRPVKIFTAGEIERSRVRDFPGTIRAAQTAEMAFEVAGKITEFLVQEGDQIEQGQTLARLDPRDYTAELDKRKANLAKAQADLNRSESIFKEDPGAISKEKIDSDRRAVGVAKATLDQASKGVEDTELVAPFSGLMARKLVEDFQNVKAKEPVLILQDLAHLEIEVSIPERDVSQGPGMASPDEVTKRVSPRVVVSSLPGREFPARVKEMTTNADPTTRTFQVKLIFERPADVNILPGMTARVITDPAGGDAPLIPSQATRADSDGNPYVWLVDPDTMKVSRRKVELGELTGGEVAILSGLERGDQIAISGVKQLTDGMEVSRYESERGAQKS